MLLFLWVVGLLVDLVPHHPPSPRPRYAAAAGWIPVDRHARHWRAGQRHRALLPRLYLQGDGHHVRCDGGKGVLRRAASFQRR